MTPLNGAASREGIASVFVSFLTNVFLCPSLFAMSQGQEKS